MSTTKNPNLTGSLSARDVRTSGSDNRYLTPIKVRYADNRTQTGTQISQMSQASQMNSGILSRSSSLCNIDNRHSSIKTSTPLLDVSILKELGKDPIILDEEKPSLPSFIKGINKEGDFVIAPKPTKIQLKPLDGKRRDNSVQKSNRKKNKLSPLDMRRIRDDFQKMNTVNRDISVTVEPIASDSYRKVIQVNKSIARKAVRISSVDSVPKSEFEEQVLESMNQRFMWFKLQNEIKMLKPVQPERFVVGAREEVYFKIRPRGLRFPLKGKVDISGKTPHCIFEILVSTTVPRPRRNNCEKRYIGRNFNIEIGSKVEWIYFTLAALTDLDITLTISPSMNKAAAEKDKDESVNDDVPIYLKESYKLGLNKRHSNKDKLYPYLNYTYEQMANFYSEIKHIKSEKKNKYRELARGGRDIVSDNKSQVWIYDKSYMLEQIQHSSRKRDESIENVIEKREDIDYKDKVRRFFVMNREEFRHNVREEMDINYRRQEKINKKSLKWFQILLRRSILYELAQRIHNARAQKLLWRIKNRKITVIQRAFRKHMRKVAESYYLRKVKSAKEALNANSLMILQNVKKKAARLLNDFLNECLILKDINARLLKYSSNVVKIQKMIKRFYFIRHFQRVCLNLMIEDMLGLAADDKRKEKVDKDKEKKKIREGGKKKSRLIDKELEKEREKIKIQFDNALQINKDFRIFVARLYQRKIMKKYLKKLKLYNDNLASPIKIEYPRELEGQDSEMQIDFSLSVSASPTQSQRGQGGQGATKKKLLSLESMKSRKPTLSRGSSIMTKTKTLEFQAKKAGERIKPTLRFIYKEALVAFMDERFMSIVRKAKEDSNLSWLFQ